MTRRLKCIVFLALAFGAGWAMYCGPQNVAAGAGAPVGPVSVRDFLAANCFGCHNGRTKKGNLDLTALSFDPEDAKTFAVWVRVYDRVRDGEMPPKAAEQPDAATRAAFLKALAGPMIPADEARVRREGRAAWGRMNRYEYEKTLRDLLGAPWLQVKELLPEDGEAWRFNKTGEALGVSHVQMSRYLMAAEQALREVMAREAAPPAASTKRYYAREQRAFASHVEFSQFNTASERATFPLIGNAADVAVLKKEAPMTVGAADPAKRELEGMGVVASTYEPLEIRFNQFKAPVAGRYRLRVNAHSFWAGPESEAKWWKPSRTDASAGRTREPVTLYAEIPPRQMRYLGTFDVKPEGSVSEMEVYLLKDETIRPDAARLFRSLEVEGPICDQWPGPGHRLMFGDLPITKNAKGAVEVVSRNPHTDAERLVRGFLRQAYRRPVVEEDVRRFLKLADTALESGVSFADAMITAYSAVLCSPAFVTLEEKPG